MRIQFPDKVVSPAHYNWARTDIRSVPIVMGAGSSNPLGRVKFMFPNHHAVYMHDTPDKHLFKNSKRLFSHGCIRVRDPIRFAEVVLGESSNWSDSEIAAQLTRQAQENNRFDLEKTISVHNTYFTLVATEDGKLEKLPDIYGHDKRIKQALAGKSLKVIASSDPARIHKREIDRLAKSAPSYYMAEVEQPPTNFWGFFQPQPYTPYSLGGQNGYGAPKQKKKYAKKKKKRVGPSWRMNPYTPY